MSDQPLDRRGLWVAIGAFLAWGVMPLWWHLMKSVPSFQIVLHRILWSAVIVGAFLFWRDGRGWLKQALSKPHTWWMLALSGVLIGFNWGLYIWAVNAGHVVETSLGYFINPLLNVLLGVAFLRERLGRAQWVSVAIATLGVAWLTLRFGQLPWIALALAGSFALYGLIRKLAAVDSVSGLGVEGAYLFLPVAAMLAWSETHGQGGFFDGYGLAMSAMLVVSGGLTALPLVGFAYAVRRVPLSIVGLLQYIAPTMQFLLGVFVFHEAFDGDRAIGFACIWVALAIFAVDGALRARRANARATLVPAHDSPR
ncbi:RarD protein, DMT superfamily transporter [Lysobacter dokdonensis DS-58]|uniref:RarD protein, DMT superfamily transporter n=1 Tax=Lysobacter dokdonensis DS-58 TaxID=1300345 RepID=A0A0A2WY50_9GAMM|nr:EamA family transporter RarD [Lysobacter dokdonensis]KGQ17959.1 RarD protein, DMT superfamily transporter [Lysobacter dokdonensis DS-58]